MPTAIPLQSFLKPGTSWADEDPDEGVQHSFGGLLLMFAVDFLRRPRSRKRSSPAAARPSSAGS